MTEVVHNPQEETCGCLPFPSSVEGTVCPQCSPNEPITREEIDILARMREIKLQARAVKEQLNAFQSQMKQTLDQVSDTVLPAEFEDLSRQLDELRSGWKDWEQKLQDAVERKLIMLGHRKAEKK